jgi:hypothetical protein
MNALARYEQATLAERPPSELSAPYWKAAREHRLAVQQCMSCQRYLHPPGPSCSWCGGSELSWLETGEPVTGSIYSFLSIHRAFSANLAELVPYVMALADVDLFPGIRICLPVVGLQPDEARIGERVRMCWADWPDGRSLPLWEIVHPV